MKLHPLLTEDTVLARLKGRSRDEVLQEMAECLRGRTAATPGQDLLEKLLAREALGTTAIGGGVAIPHCKVEGLKAPVLALGISRKGVSFQSLDGEDTHIIFLVVSHQENPGVNLRLLASVAKLVRKSGTLTPKLVKAPTAKDALRVLREEEDGAHA
jgi:mannitol/fructose-specific phosphotransferase system IIA component (Ntr-type)